MSTLLQPAIWAMFGFIILGVLIGPLNNTCCLVGPDAAYKTIQSAVNAAPAGSTIVVFSGIYRETITINKPIRIVTANHTAFTSLVSKSRPLIQGYKEDQPVIDILVPNVIIQGFSIRGGQVGIRVNTRRVQLMNNEITQGNIGILLEEAQDVEITQSRIADQKQIGVHILNSEGITFQGNTVEKNPQGVRLEQTSKNVVRNNIFRHQTEQAIHVIEAPTNALVGNRFRGETSGILLSDSPNTIMRNNELASGSASFWVEGDVETAYEQDIDRSNTLGKRTMLYINGIRNKTFKSGLELGFLALVNASNITLPNLNANNVPVGALLINSSDITLTLSNFQSTRVGLLAIESDNISVSDSVITSGQGNGLQFENSSGVTIERMTISGNEGNGIHIVGGSDVILQGNEIISNKSSGIWLEAVTEGTINDNILGGNEQYATSLLLTRDVTLHHNLIQANQTGLYLELAEANFIQQNQIQQNQFGIFLKNAINNTIVDNDITLNPRGSIKGTLENNTIEDNIE